MRKLVIALAVTLLVPTALAANDGDKEITAKAQFLVELADHIEWQEDTNQAAKDNVTIYVVGESPVTEALLEQAAAASSESREIKVEVVSVNDDFTGCQILYLASDDLGVLAKVLKKVNGTKIITVADAKDFARYGAMINFVVEDGSKVGYVINKLVAETIGVKLDSKLMDKAVLI